MGTLTPYAKQTIFTGAIGFIQLSQDEEEYKRNYIISSFIIFFVFFLYNIIITQVSLEKRLQDVITSVEGARQPSRQTPVRSY